MTKSELYCIGVEAACEFLDFNNLQHPVFMTYEQALSESEHPADRHHATNLLRRVAGGPTLGTGSGLYSDNHVFVNVPVTAWPVQNPSMRSWSWPGWKTDRTAIGVVAHEVGHHIAEAISPRFTVEERVTQRAAWLVAIRGKKVSGYEPVPGEAAAESMRLFILNPDLLRKAIPARYNFICGLGLRALPKLLRKGYAKVLNNPAYTVAAERFIG